METDNPTTSRDNSLEKQTGIKLCKYKELLKNNTINYKLKNTRWQIEIL